jgi:hypothetical protein
MIFIDKHAREAMEKMASGDNWIDVWDAAGDKDTLSLR